MTGTEFLIFRWEVRKKAADNLLHAGISKPKVAILGTTLDALSLPLCQQALGGDNGLDLDELSQKDRAALVHAIALDVSTPILEDYHAKTFA